MIRGSDQVAGQFADISTLFCASAARRIVPRQVSPDFNDLRPDQIRVVEDPFAGSRQRMTQRRCLNQILSGGLQRQIVLLQPRQNRLPVLRAICGTRPDQAFLFNRVTPEVGPHREYCRRSLPAQRRYNSFNLPDPGLDHDQGLALQLQTPVARTKRCQPPCSGSRDTGLPAMFQRLNRTFSVRFLGGVKSQNDPCRACFQWSCPYAGKVHLDPPHDAGDDACEQKHSRHCRYQL